MKHYHLRRQQFLPITQAEAWSFFSSPENLGKITPARMNFVIVSTNGRDKLFKGQQITYRITVLPLIRVTWVTAITDVQDQVAFTDEQRKGPYALWRHTHTFLPVDGGIEMHDHVVYSLPLGWIGRLAHALFVGPQVNLIFDYRYKVLEAYFHST